MPCRPTLELIIQTCEAYIPMGANKALEGLATVQRIAETGLAQLPETPPDPPKPVPPDPVEPHIRFATLVSDLEDDMRARTLEDSLRREVEAQGGETYTCIYPNQIVTSQGLDARIRPDATEILERIILEDTDWVFVDIEGPLIGAMNITNLEPQTLALMEEASLVFQEVTRTIKSVRPHVKVAHYRQPYLRGSKSEFDEMFLRQVLEIRKFADALSPRFYDDSVPGTDVESYMKWRMEEEARRCAIVAGYDVEDLISVGSIGGRDLTEIGPKLTTLSDWEFDFTLPTLAWVHQRRAANSKQFPDGSIAARQLVPNDEIVSDVVDVARRNKFEMLVWWDKAKRVTKQQSWSTYRDARNEDGTIMNYDQASQYLLWDLPTDLLDNVWYPYCLNVESPRSR